MRRLDTRFLIPLSVVESEKVKLTLREKGIISRVKNHMKSKNSNYFTVSEIIDRNAFNPADVKDMISLIRKRIFEPIITN